MNCRHIPVMKSHMLRQNIISRQLATTARHKRTKPQKKPVLGQIDDRNGPRIPRQYESETAELSSKEEAALRRKLLEENTSTGSVHMYKNIYPWRTRLAFAEHLKNTEVYNQDGLIALCKPYGIAQAKTNLSLAPGLSGVAGGIQPNDMPVVDDVIPDLCKMYGEPHLKVIKTPERWSSGILLLSANNKITERVKKCWQRSRGLQQTPYTFWAVTVGLPRPVAGATKAAVKLEFVDDLGKVPMIVKEYTTASLRKGDVNLSIVEHQSLMFSKDTQAALVQVKTQMQRNHFLRLWLSHMYSPALGDHLLSRRVSTVAGKKVQINPNAKSHCSQIIPDALYSKLNLPPKKSELIPCHLHLNTIELSMFNKDKSDLSISAPPPQYFMWTCKQLGLMSDDVEESEEDMENRG